jgi:general secretion pathway protein J
LPLLARNHRASGFTLLEILVVLVLVALVSTLVMEGFSFTINVQSRLKRQLINNQLHDLQELWFRQITRSYKTTNLSSKEVVFRGDSTTIAGTAMVELTGNAGIPVTTHWEIETSGKTQSLSYESELIPKTIIATWQSTKIQFQYLGQDGEFYQHWPIETLPNQLPKGILVSSLNKTEVFWYVSISSTLPPLLNLSEIQ